MGREYLMEGQLVEEVEVGGIVVVMVKGVEILEETVIAAFEISKSIYRNILKSVTS
jgi:hypothetical protein